MSGLQEVDGIVDDLIIIGSSEERHLSILESAFERMSGMEIKLKKEKSVFMKPTVEYFAFVVDLDGIHSSPHDVPENLQS